MKLQIQAACTLPSVGSQLTSSGLKVQPYGLEEVNRVYCLLPRVVQAWLWLARRWYRSQINKSGLVCCVHQDREATLQCTICARHAQNPAEKRQSYHCSPDCLKQHWATHRKLHIKQQKRAQGAQSFEHLAKLRASLISVVFMSYLLP